MQMFLKTRDSHFREDDRVYCHLLLVFSIYGFPQELRMTGVT